MHTSSRKTIKTTEYHPKANRRVESFSRTTVSRMRQYSAAYQKDWEAFVLHLTYTYNENT